MTGGQAYAPGRTLRFEYASDAIADVEATSCRLGCTRAGGQEQIAEFGPGGNCGLLVAVVAGNGPIEEIRDDGRHLTCVARVDPRHANTNPLF